MRELSLWFTGRGRRLVFLMTRQQSDDCLDVSSKSNSANNDPYHRFSDYMLEERRRAKLCTSERLIWFCPNERPQTLAGTPPVASTAPHEITEPSIASARLPRQRPPYFQVNYPDSFRLFQKNSGITFPKHRNAFDTKPTREMELNLKATRSKFPGYLFDSLACSADEQTNQRSDLLPNARLNREKFKEIVQRTREKYIWTTTACANIGWCLITFL